MTPPLSPPEAESRCPFVSFFSAAGRLQPRTATRLLTTFLSLAHPAAAPAQPATTTTTIEGVVAVVDSRPLLLSDRRALEHVRGLAPEAALEALVDERLMYVEASRLTQAEVLPEEEERAVASLVERRPELARLVPAPDLVRLVRRQIAILKYVEFRFRPQLRVSDQDVRAAFESDPTAGDSWEAARERVRERLERRALDDRVEAWVKELRARAEVRYVTREAPAAR